MLTEASVFILFDTSNYMYRGFVFAQDAITDFVRSMDDASKIAFYSYSRDLSRAIHTDFRSFPRDQRGTQVRSPATMPHSITVFC